MTPYKLHSLVRRKGTKTILMIIERRVYQYNLKTKLHIMYTLIEPHNPDYQTTSGHEGIEPLVSS